MCRSPRAAQRFSYDPILGQTTPGCHRFALHTPCSSVRITAGERTAARQTRESLARTAHLPDRRTAPRYIARVHPTRPRAEAPPPRPPRPYQSVRHRSKQGLDPCAMATAPHAPALPVARGNSERQDGPRKKWLLFRRVFVMVGTRRIWSFSTNKRIVLSSRLGARAAIPSHPTGILCRIHRIIPRKTRVLHTAGSRASVFPGAPRDGRQDIRESRETEPRE